MHKQFPDIPLPHLIVSVRGKLRSYRLARNLDDTSIPEPIFWLPNKPPEGWNVTEEEWERGIALCLQPECWEDGTGMTSCIQSR